jgi:hypothetical protein
MTPWWNGSRCAATPRTRIARTIAVVLATRTVSAGSVSEPRAGHGAEDDLSPRTSAADSDRAGRG